ncbi:hypothetical protein HYX10_01745 [Candidatus Woesearchaeota archaeon]|nr:hypothetical protein [Candidatus Woesearchaeota archaeon]
MKFKADDIVIWVLLLASVAILLWLLKGSPTLESALLTIGLFIISSEFLLWRKYFDVGKNTAVAFVKIKNDIGNVRNDISNLITGQREMGKKLNKIEKLIRLQSS